MRMRTVFFGALLALSSTAGCGASDENLRARAAFDLNCPEQTVKVVELDERTRGVSGCGQRATYVENCEVRPYHRACSWILNHEAKPDKAAATPQGENKP